MHTVWSNTQRKPRFLCYAMITLVALMMIYWIVNAGNIGHAQVALPSLSVHRVHEEMESYFAFPVPVPVPTPPAAQSESAPTPMQSQATATPAAPAAAQPIPVPQSVPTPPANQ